MKNWQNEFIGDVVYEVEQEHRSGGGVTLNLFKTKAEADADARYWFNNLSKYEQRAYFINVCVWRWNAETGGYEYIESQTIEEEEEV